MFVKGLLLVHKKSINLIIKNSKLYYLFKTKFIRFSKFIDNFNDKNHSVFFKYYKTKNKIKTIKNFQYLLCGVFWQYGSISKNKDSLIIDIFLLNKNDSLFIHKLLLKYDIHSFVFQKNKKYYVRIKNISSVANTLLLFNCIKKAYSLFNNSASMEIKQHISGSTNFQIYNDVKSMELATKQIKAINKLELIKHLNISKKEKIIFNYRKKYPYASLRKLTTIINNGEKTNFSISTVYRYLKKVSISNNEVT